ncbi:hypothetical protein BDV38DRAFT_255046 [Aspergillus pseudotamarii]|uniref:Uncharacterized protein n=1 Tax=Aspergillus pseudotamarii TaxID=132259 RepID=A0A5N6SMX6_ASPPS|nr:uncharacterized protein BDV38DRAFT_255046 [Aspergillus pseudotamarii]KAE8134504.1 hypothetical protein BDV38DRAFT_255046 [Aspergillus pseudotamarii]
MKGIALSGQRASRSQPLICQFCRSSASPATRPRTHFTRSFASTGPFISNKDVGLWKARKNLKNHWATTQMIPSRFASNTPETTTPRDLEDALRQITHDSAELRQLDSVPSNEAIVRLLQRCEEVAEALVHQEQDTTKKGDNEISTLLDLEEKSVTKKRTKSPKIADPRLANALSEITYELLTDEKVFISPEALAGYTKVQSLLKRAEHFPEIFHLYAHKPVPEENSSPVKFHKANPKDINSAIPTELANMALEVASEQRNLSLVLAIIDNTFCAPAFSRAKVFKKAAVPLGGLAAAPAACYAIASWAATLQNTMDPSTATGIAFAASLAYVGGVSSVGILAITTANDQMERVTWLPGVPLRHRWLREEERAALDRVALKWGFKDIYMRGEEEGEEWENLREFIGMRGMILDKTDLMPGMQ